MKSLHRSTALTLILGLGTATVLVSTPAGAQGEPNQGGLSAAILQHCFGTLDANADQSLAWDEIQSLPWDEMVTALGEGAQDDQAAGFQAGFDAAAARTGGTLDLTGFTSMFGAVGAAGGEAGGGGDAAAADGAGGGAGAGLSAAILQHCFGGLDANADQSLAWDEVETGLGEGAQDDQAAGFQAEFDAAAARTGGTLDPIGFASMFGAGGGAGGGGGG